MMADDMKRNGGFIPGFRPGKPTSDFIAKVLNKVTLSAPSTSASWPSAR